jgi:hypothetical protein
MHTSHPSPFIGSYISGSKICRVGSRNFKKIPVQSVRVVGGEAETPNYMVSAKKRNSSQ